MRLIDADALKQNAYTSYECASQPCKVVDVSDIDDAPTVDAVRVVRCGECKFYNRCTDHQGICMNRYMDGFIVPDWYCADGERREE